MTAVAAAPAQRRRRPRRNGAPYLLITPIVLLLGLFLVYPVASVVYYSLQNYNVTQPYNNGFAGFGNFTAMVQDPLFWQSLRFTAKFVLVEVVLQLIVGLGLALAINQSFRGRTFTRALVFAPWAISGVLTTELFVLIYNPTTGLGHVMNTLGLGHADFAPLSGTGTVFWATVVAELWRGVPFFAILLLADLQTLSADLLEAAKADGASAVQRFRYIVFPHLRDAIVLTTLLRAVWEFNNVDLLYTLTGGGPANETTTLPLYVANKATGAHDFGYGSALTVAGFVILLLFSVLYLRLSRFNRREA